MHECLYDTRSDSLIPTQKYVPVCHDGQVLFLNHHSYDKKLRKPKFDASYFCVIQTFHFNQ